MPDREGNSVKERPGDGGGWLFGHFAAAAVAAAGGFKHGLQHGMLIDSDCIRMYIEFVSLFVDIFLG